MSSENTAK